MIGVELTITIRDTCSTHSLLLRTPESTHHFRIVRLPNGHHIPDECYVSTVRIHVVHHVQSVKVENHLQSSVCGDRRHSHCTHLTTAAFSGRRFTPQHQLMIVVDERVEQQHPFTGGHDVDELCARGHFQARTHSPYSLGTSSST